MDTAHLFQSGRSLAVRLPKAYRFSGTEVIREALRQWGAAAFDRVPGLLLDNWVPSA
jgi:hypothetical protein